jgi:hypothetical protein
MERGLKCPIQGGVRRINGNRIITAEKRDLLYN